MYPVIYDFDPMILESGLRYPKTLDEAVLVARGKAFQEQEPTSLTKPYEKSNLVIEGQHEGSDSGSPLNSTAAGSDGRAKVIAAGEKKWKRCSKKSSGGGTDGRAQKKRKNWTDEETEMLLKVVPQKTKFRSRIDKFSDSGPSWEGIAKELVFERTGDECRRRMDTLIKSYKVIKQYCENQKIEVSHLNENFEDTILAMPKLATRFKGSWYNYVHDYCPPRSNKNFMRKQGAGNSFEKRALADAMLHEEPSCDVKQDVETSTAAEQPQHTSEDPQCHSDTDAGVDPEARERREDSSYLLQCLAPVQNTDLRYAAIGTPVFVPPTNIEDPQTIFLQDFCFDFDAEDFVFDTDDFNAAFGPF